MKIFRRLFGAKEQLDRETEERRRLWAEQVPYDRRAESLLVVTGTHRPAVFEKDLYPVALARVLMEIGRGNGTEALSVRCLVPVVSRKKSRKAQKLHEEELCQAAGDLLPWMRHVASEEGLLLAKEELDGIEPWVEGRHVLVEGPDVSECTLETGKRRDLRPMTFHSPIVVGEGELTERARRYNMKRFDAYAAEKLDQEYDPSQGPEQIAEGNRALLQAFEKHLEERRVGGDQRERLLFPLRLLDEHYLRELRRGSFDRLGAEDVVDRYLGSHFVEKLHPGRREMEATIKALRAFYRFLADRERETPAGSRAAEIVRALQKKERHLMKGLRP